MHDLSGKTTANTLGSSYATLAESYGATNTGVDDFNQTIELLEAGRIDATLNDEVVFYDYMEQHPKGQFQNCCREQSTHPCGIPAAPRGGYGIPVQRHERRNRLAARERHARRAFQ